jgi:hypothetical protein
MLTNKLMIMRKLIFTIGLVLIIFITNAQTVSPELISSSGDSFSNATYQLDWSVGECATVTHSAGDYVLTQGFHQGVYVISEVENIQTDLCISVYPNPTTDFISLKIENLNNESIQFTITDLSGKILHNAEIKSNLEQINFTDFALGTYFISITKQNQLVKSFKIIKN